MRRLVLIIFLFLLVGCTKKMNEDTKDLYNDTTSLSQVKDESQDNMVGKAESNQKMDNNVLNESAIEEGATSDNSVTLLKENTYPEYRYFSPNQANYIRVTYSPMGSSFNKELFLNESKDVIDTVGAVSESKLESPAYWLSNHEVLINGQFILDIKDMNEKNLNIDSFFDLDSSFDYKVNYSVNKFGTKVAYSYTEDNNLILCLYDMASEKFNKVGNYTFNMLPLENRLIWDKDENIYFNSEINDAFQIIKYNSDTGQSETFYENHHIILDIAQNDQHAILYDWNDNHINILSMHDKNVILDIKTPYWYHNNESFIYYNTESKSIEIFIYKTNTSKKLIDVFEVIGTEEAYIVFDYIDGYYTAFIDDYPLDFEDYQPSGSLFKILY